MKLLLALLFVPGLVAAQALNPDVSQSNIGSTICVAGWTKTVRPPVTYTNGVKKRKMLAAGLLWKQSPLYELDHIVPLTLGGAPRTAVNLQLQLWPEAKVKDRLEVRLNKKVCARKMTLTDARYCIFLDWKQCAKSN